MMSWKNSEWVVERTFFQKISIDIFQMPLIKLKKPLIFKLKTRSSQKKKDSGQDTQVILTDSIEGASVYVHHLTLLDIFARGYVRPIAISYVTRDSRKIMSNFQTFVKKFSEVR